MTRSNEEWEKWNELRDRQFNFWWSTEPFGYDHPETKDGIKQLMDWAYELAKAEQAGLKNQILELLEVSCAEHTTRTLGQMKITTLRTQIAEQREALGYYAHEEHYEKRLTMTGVRPEGVLVEGGAKARDVLAKWKDK